MRILVRHRIAYRYSAPVWLAPQQVLMRPRENHHVTVLRHQLAIQPEAQVFRSQDTLENNVVVARFRDPTDRLEVEASFEVETRLDNPFDFLVREDAAHHPFAYNPEERLALSAFVDPVACDAAASGSVPDIPAWLRSVLPEFPDDSLELVTRLNRTLAERIDYRRRDGNHTQSPEETLRRGSGTCRDFSVFMVQACRALGFAGRHVSGYLHDPSTPPEGGRGGELHAWVEIYLPGAGWVGFDPTHAILVDAHFIPVAVGPQMAGLNPVIGSFRGDPGTTAHMDAQVELATA